MWQSTTNSAGAGDEAKHGVSPGKRDAELRCSNHSCRFELIVSYLSRKSERPSSLEAHWSPHAG